MLRDADNDAGFYAAVASTEPSWPGAVLMRSTDGGATFQTISSFAVRAVIGTTQTALGNFGGGNIPDELNTVRVRLVAGALSSVPFAAFIEGAQMAVIGDEIVCFREAILDADGSYLLRGFLRGRRGSDYAMATHIAGERFVLLSAQAIKRIAGTTADLNIERFYKCVTAGRLASSASAQAFTNVGAGLKPYAPVHLGGGRDAGGDLTIRWTRRTRISGEWRDGVDVPLAEENERYEAEIWQGPYLRRTFADLSAPSLTYTAAQRLEDLGGVDAPFLVRVFQLSAIVGRGYPATASF